MLSVEREDELKKLLKEMEQKTDKSEGTDKTRKRKKILPIRYDDVDEDGNATDVSQTEPEEVCSIV